MKISITIEKRVDYSQDDGIRASITRSYDDVLVAEAGLRFQVEEYNRMVPGESADHDCHADTGDDGCDHPSHKNQPEE